MKIGKKSRNIYFKKITFLSLRLFFWVGGKLLKKKIMPYFSLKILSKTKPEKYSFGLHSLKKDTLNLQIDSKALILYWSSNKIKQPKPNDVHLIFLTGQKWLL